MSIVLDGTTGITTPGLTNTGTETIVNLTTTGNTILGDASTDTLNVGNGGLVKDASGNVGIGTASPGATLDLRGTYRQIQATDAQALNSLTQLTLQRNGNDSRLCFGYTTGNSAWNITASYGSTGAYAPIAFATSDTERMRIDSSGNLLVNTTSVAAGCKATISTSSDAQLAINCTTTSGTVYSTISFCQDNSARTQLFQNHGVTRFFVVNTSAGVYLASGGTSWTSASDERYKTNLQPIENAVAKVSALRSVTGRFLEDAEDVSRSFLIAQDVQTVFPQAVDLDDPEKLGVRYTDVIPLLVAAIKEQNQLITTLTDRITALETPTGTQA